MAEVNEEAPKKTNKLKKALGNLKEKNKRRKSLNKEKKDFKKFHDKDGKVLTTVNSGKETPPVLDLIDKLEKGTFTDEELGVKTSTSSVSGNGKKEKYPTWVLVLAAVIVLIIILRLIFK